MTEPEIQIVTVKSGSSADVRDYSWNTPGRHDYRSEGYRIERILDRDGREYEPVWGDRVVELFPGCTTSQREGYRYLHVASEACPVRVLHCYWYQYTGSRPEHGAAWEIRTWLHFVLDTELGE